MTHFDFPLFAPRLDTAVEDPQSDVLTIPRLDDSDSDTGAYRVILYNDEWHTLDQVIEQLMKACQHNEAEATAVAAEAHFRGRAVCYKGGKGKCHKAARILREIRLQCEVDCDD